MKILLVCNYKPGVGGISGQVEILQRKLREEGHVADIFSTKGSLRKRLGLFCELKRTARSYDTLHIHCCSGWGFLPAVVGISVGRKLKKHIALTYHGGGAETFFRKHTCFVRHYLLQTDTNIVLSGFLANIFDHYHIPHTIIPNIIELDATLFRERTIINPNYICVRAHEELYNIPCILRAFKHVQKALPEATLTLVGDGSQHTTLVNMADEMGLKNVTFTGRVDNSEIYRYLDEADILLSSPTIDNMPVSLLEAMNAGLLVISSNVGGVPYIIEDNKTGYLFRSNDSDALAALMVKAARQLSESITIIHNAHEAVKAYRWENIRQQLFKVYGISA